MARLFSAPKPRGGGTLPAVAPPPPAPLPPPAAPTAPVSRIAPPAPPASDIDPATAALSSLLRRAVGRGGTILTTPRGVLTPGGLAPRRKRLLGE